ncbi:FAD-dependent oxidoreductase [Microbacterium stercoris]|uniref:ferredoxin--NADP(+) reductase n=1 Tax=Microbacterium stercoris TaxID=2820289 RepID=A0A939QGU4_9MICO|nr:FAD-dependent oxidoreductase [Microbacterium stercoris]MBO3662523.1 FAD-dependent oxidoreductase [Microbacterium stercoris]MBO3664515.1 FAD-dependent oxidoreductase [Microbacterium stercoris]
MSSDSPLDLRVAIVGAGPAGIYAGNLLANAVEEAGGTVAIDLLESLPAPYGLIRYGVSPDHPRIKGIINSLEEMLDSGRIRFLGNIEVGKDVSLDELRERYHAVILATGAIRDAALDIPGVDKDGSYGAADFVSWFDGHPDVPRTWPLEAEQIAVIGNGNVALDVARMLAKHPVDLRSTEIPDNVLEGLESSPVTDVHVFGRRGPADIKFTPIELRELGELNDVDIVLDEADFEGVDLASASTNQMKIMLRTLNAWRGEQLTGASRRVHLHFWHAPAEILGDEKVEAMRFERTRIEDGRLVGTGEFAEYPLQAVYRAVGYFGSPIDGAPFDPIKGVISNIEGRVAGIQGLYATGWIKRGPVGLIGHTKSDAMETVDHLVTDAQAGILTTPLETGLLELLDEREVEYTTWAGWLALDAHERALGETHLYTRERVKVVPRDEQVEISRSGALAGA